MFSPLRFIAPVIVFIMGALALGAPDVATAAVTRVNPGFETGDLSGWSPAGSVFVSSNFAGHTAPYGSNFAVLQAACPTSTLQQNFTASAGDVVSGQAAFVAGDYLPFNDNASVRITQGNVILFYRDVSMVGDFGATPWIRWSYTIPTSGTYTLSGQVSNVLDCALASYLLLDSEGGPPPDTTPPVITSSVTGTLGANGWYTSNVTVSWTVSDPESTVTSTSGCGTSTVTADTAGVTFTCTATSAGGTSSKSVTVKRDATPPTITGSRTPGANANGWNNTDVTVSFACADGLSGVNSCSSPTTLTGEGANQSVTGAVADKAGNTASATVSGINIDKTPPTITGSRTPVANANCWNNTDVTVSFVCADGLSGVDSCSSLTTLTGEGANQSVTGAVADKAGNTASATVGNINIDKTPPTLSCAVTPGAIWPPNHKLVDVIASVTVTGGLSGSAGFVLVSVSSNEPDNGLGDGDTANDIQGFTLGTPDTTGQVRAERSGTGTGRVYTITYQGADLAGNTANCSVTVSVPHDRG